MRTLKCLSRSLICSYVLSLLLLLALSLLLYRFHLPVSKAEAGIFALYAISSFLGGFLSGKSKKSRRFFWGLLSGVLYFAVLLLMTLLTRQKLSGDTTSLLQTLLICAIGGTAGGLLS